MDVGAVADDLAIKRTLAAYCHCVDDGRFDDLVELFTEDGVFSFGRLGAEGRDGLRSWFAEFQPVELRGKHLTTNSVLDLAGDRATATSDFVFLSYDGGRLLPTMTGRYLDQLERVDGRWLISRRDAVPLRPPR